MSLGVVLTPTTEPLILRLPEAEKCGEWIEDGETVTYDPCPPDLEDAN